MKCGKPRREHHLFKSDEPKDAWNKDASDDWQKHYQGNPQPWYFKNVKDLVREYTWQRVRPVLNYYLQKTPIEYVNLSKLKAAFGKYEERLSKEGHGQSRLIADPTLKGDGTL